MAPTQKGTSIKLGFGNFAYTGYVPEDGLRWKKVMLEKRVVKDADALTLTKIFADPADEFEMDLIILSATGSTTPPQEGATVSITDPANAVVNCMVVESSVEFARLGDKLTLSLIKEGSMTYT